MEDKKPSMKPELFDGYDGRELDAKQTKEQDAHFQAMLKMAPKPTEQVDQPAK